LPTEYQSISGDEGLASDKEQPHKYSLPCPNMKYPSAAVRQIPLGRKYN